MFRFLLLLFVFFSIAFSNNNLDAKIACIILEDENSIICKFQKKRTYKDENVLFQWIDPLNNISRERTMLIPKGHGSIYDYRYIKGRIKGKWTVKVQYKNKDYLTEFEIK